MYAGLEQKNWIPASFQESAENPAKEAVSRFVRGNQVIGLGSGPMAAAIVREMANVENKETLACIPTSFQIKLEAVAKPETQERFAGALPTTIFHGFSEVYGSNPDIDSTAFMISATSWILTAYLKAGMVLPPLRSEGALDSRDSVVSDPSIVINFAVPRMISAVDYLARRDSAATRYLSRGTTRTGWMPCSGQAR